MVCTFGELALALALALVLALALAGPMALSLSGSCDGRTLVLVCARE